MSLLADELEQVLPALYAQDDLGEDAIVHVHFFNPSGTGDWWITEGSREGDDFIMFGLCGLGFPEFGYVSLNELESVRSPLGWVSSGIYIGRPRHFVKCGRTGRIATCGELPRPAFCLG